MRVNLVVWHRWILLCSIQHMLLLVPVSSASEQGNTIRYQTNEEDGPGTTIGNLARDMSLSPSHASRTNFRMMRQFNDSHVRVRESDGELTVGERIDRERMCRHGAQQCLIEFDVVNFSKDRYRLIHVQVEVRDVNDNSPEFPSRESAVEISESAAVGSRVPLDPAVDADTGRLTLRSPVDFEDKATYEVDVQASDLGSNPTPSVCKIIIHVKDVNDNAPEISITPMTSTATGVAYISEAADKDSLVALISTLDRDSGVNGQVHCTLYGHDHFKLKQAHEDSYMIVTAALLDRERIAEYNLTVMAEDFGSPPLRKIIQYTIRLTDENDNAPHFSKPVYDVSVVENNAPGAFITTVEARDADLGNNGKITYRLLDGLLMGSPVNTFVSLNSITGSIYALRSFNYEVMKVFELHVQASDSGVPQLQTRALIRLRILDQNDNQPTVVQPVLYKGSVEVFLPRDAPAGYVVAQIKATDADDGTNAQLSYRIAEGGHLGFSINKATGKMHASRQLAYDVADVARVTVAVSDSGVPALTSTATLLFSFVEGPVPSAAATSPQGPGGGAGGEELAWDTSVAIIIVLAGSCSLLLLAILLITTTCCQRHRRREKGRVSGRRGGGEEEEGEEGEEEDEEDEAEGEKGGGGGGDVPSAPDKGGKKGTRIDAVISKHKGAKAFEACPYAEPSPVPGGVGGGGGHPANEVVVCGEDERQTAVGFESGGRAMEGKLKGYSSTLPGYGKETLRPVTIWKGNSFTTISARDPQISGKDSGKGDSDFNDSDSDISGDTHKKDSLTPHSLWACTSECKVLGHSDRCWSPSASRPNTSLATAVGVGPHLSTFSSSRTASLPRDARREIYYPVPQQQQQQQHLAKPHALQSVYEQVQHQEFDYILVGPPTPARIQETDEISIPEYSHS
ncbi:hypothetical protein CRUP_018399 [Coryphaenoides rupestris]|nr:hypothetical protein CRUP_018399 [Coryphaenoides rupestris]